jgi:VWFA-related protein
LKILRFPLSVAIAAVALAGVHAARQPPGIGRGQSIFVVAVRAAGDNRVLRNCSLGRPRPAPARELTGPELLPAGGASLPGGVPDPDLRAAAERVLRAQKRLAVVSSVEQADLVLFIQGDYAPVFTATMPGQPRVQDSRSWPPPPPAPWRDEPAPSFPVPEPPRATAGQPALYISAGQPDIPPNSMIGLVAIVVPAPVYRQSSSDAAALLGARLWEGWEIGANASPVTPVSMVKSVAGSRDRIYWPRLPRGDFTGTQAVCLAPAPPRAAPPPIGPGDAHGEGPAPATTAARAGTPAAGNALATFRTAVDAVAVPVTVDDETGRPVADLTAADFRVFEDDVEKRIEAVLTRGEPLDVALVLDTSPSMRARLEEIRAAAGAFVEALGDRDRVMVVSFNSRAYVGCELTADRGEIRRAILQARTGGSLTRLYDTLDAVVTERLDHVARRKAIVLLTDGVDVGSGFATAQGTIERVQSSNVPVFVLRWDSERDPRPGPPSVMPRGTQPLAVPSGFFYTEPLYRAAKTFLWDLGPASGGRTDGAATPGEVVDGFGRIAAELGRQYVLYYYSRQAPSGDPHRIRVEVSRPNVIVRSRTVYRPAR